MRQFLYYCCFYDGILFVGYSCDDSTELRSVSDAFANSYSGNGGVVVICCGEAYIEVEWLMAGICRIAGSKRGRCIVGVGLSDCTCCCSMVDGVLGW